MEYKTYSSKVIEKNHKDIIEICSLLYKEIKNQINSDDTTWTYKKYNLFTVSSCNGIFYDLFKELSHIIKDFIGDSFNEKRFWIQAWLNYHEGGSVEKSLNVHGHGTEYHGYISIDPKDTTTIFNNGLKIKNEIGKIYIGPGSGSQSYKLPYSQVDRSFEHYVKINKPYDGTRITIGFNIASELDQLVFQSKFIPLI